MRNQVTIENQLDIFQVHQYENNTESQNNLNKRKSDFSKQCQKIFDLMMCGEEITSKNAMMVHNIQRLSSRISDLKINGVHYSEKWDETDHFKIWFMSDVDKLLNKKFTQLQD